jgi:hypothetical protein
VSQELRAVKSRSYGIDLLPKLRKYRILINNSVKSKQVFEFNCDLLNTVSCYENNGVSKTMKNVFIILIATISFGVQATTKDSSNVKVQLISAWASSGGILLQTNPKHSIEGLSCTNDYWLELDKNQPGYQAILSMLLSAQATQKTITVRAVDDNSSDFCRLERVITTP